MKKYCLGYFAILSKYGTKNVIKWKSMTYYRHDHDFSFFLSFVKYKYTFYIEIYWETSFLLAGQEKRLFGIGCANTTQYDCFLV